MRNGFRRLQQSCEMIHLFNFAGRAQAQYGMEERSALQICRMRLMRLSGI